MMMMYKVEIYKKSVSMILLILMDGQSLEMMISTHAAHNKINSSSSNVIANAHSYDPNYEVPGGDPGYDPNYVVPPGYDYEVPGDDAVSIVFNKENWHKTQEVRINYESVEDIPNELPIFFKNTSVSEESKSILFGEMAWWILIIILIT